MGDFEPSRGVVHGSTVVTEMNSLVDVDNPDTWSAAIKEKVDQLAVGLQGSTEYTSDLSVGICENEFRGLFGGRPLLAFHCTRLLDHEIAWIRAHGLRRLSPSLVEDKIDGARERGLLTEAESRRCGERNVYAIGNTAGRDGRICLVIGQAIFDLDASGLSPFLGGWGGEAMNGWPGPDEDPLLSQLGLPAIVAIGLRLDADPPVYSAPGVAKVFVGARLGLEDACGEIHTFLDIPACQIVDILQPGNPDYDQHCHLPRA